jgi:hypothetical protein
MRSCLEHILFFWMSHRLICTIYSLKQSGTYMPMCLEYLWISYDSQTKTTIELCNGEVLCFLNFKCNLDGFEFNLYVTITFLPIHLCNRLHHLQSHYIPAIIARMLMRSILHYSFLGCCYTDCIYCSRDFLDTGRGQCPTVGRGMDLPPCTTAPVTAST